MSLPIFFMPATFVFYTEQLSHAAKPNHAR